MLRPRSETLPPAAVELSGLMRLGRDPACDIVIEDARVSRIHAILEVREGLLHYRDCGSTNLSFLNSRPILEAELSNGDILSIAGLFEYEVLRTGAMASVEFVQSRPYVTGKVQTGDVEDDFLTHRLAELVEHHRQGESDTSERPDSESVRMSRILTGMQTLHQLSRDACRMLPLPQLLERIGAALIECFRQAECLAIVLRDPSAEDRWVARHVIHRGGGQEAPIAISRTVLQCATEEGATLVASDAAKDSRLTDSDSLPGLEVKSVLCAPLVSGGEVIGAFYLVNQKRPIRYQSIDAELATAFANQSSVAIENARLIETLQSHYSETLQAFINAIEAKDEYTSGHSQRVAEIAVGIARAMGLQESRIQRLRLAAQLHDIGKLALSDGLIGKPGSLTDTEFHRMRSHVEQGENILRPITYLSDILPWIAGHHERWDGSGYPRGLVGEECPLEARILGVADSFDAMTTQRSYNTCLTLQAALKELNKLGGKEFDSAVVDALRVFMQHRLSELERERETGEGQVTVVQNAVPGRFEPHGGAPLGTEGAGRS